APSTRGSWTNELAHVPGPSRGEHGRRAQCSARARKAGCRPRRHPFAEPGSAGRERKEARDVSFDLNALMKQAQEMQAQMAEMQEEAAKETAEASAGGGMV